ncbi:MAG TPA: penicillin-binding transpeptidase domain-containing protein [Gaiellaceae bacterium]|nr:penicillin-binding transpeptidase domain-containing protein [Gaiellaceae bacterium]
MSTSTPDDRRRVTLPRSLPSSRRLEPYSRADAPYFRSPGFFVRVGGLAAIVGVAIAVLVLRAWSIQVLHGPQYTAVANSQSFRVVDLQAPRGAIVDAKGRPLAGVTGHLVIDADPNALGTVDAHGRWSPTKDGLRQLGQLAKLADVTVPPLVARIRRSVFRSPFAPAVVITHPSPGLYNFLAERAQAYPAFKGTGQPARTYPQGALGAEFLGLLGEVSQNELATPRYAHAKPGQIVGQSGVEATYDSILSPGFLRAHLRVDSRGRIAGPLEVAHGKPLPTLKLTIDARIQRAADKAIRDGMALAQANGHADATSAAAVVMNPNTGAIYALSSYPMYNQVAAANNTAYRNSLYSSTNANPPLLDLATQGLYPTGSTFKPIVAEAALTQGLITPDTNLLCSGSFQLGNFTFHNVEAGVYSYMPLHTALAESCDTWFYRVGNLVYLHQPNGGDLAIQQWAHRLGLGHTTGVDLPGEAAGVVPTPAWLERTQHSPWYEGQTINLAIGQGLLAVTPLQLAVAYSALANGGTVVRPHVGSQVIDGSAVRTLKFPPVRHVKMTDLDAIRQGLYEAAHTSTGTSSAVFGNFPIPVAGKTGTAQAPSGSDHSWYASWAPATNPKVVVVVLIVHGGFGVEAAAPAAKEIYKAFFNVK